MMTTASIAVGEWFLKSGIQESSGGVARYYLCDREQNAPISTEITGYFASTLVALYQQSGERRYLEAAFRAASFLVDTAWDQEARVMPFECGPVGRTYSYFFDNGIIVRGLLAVWRVTTETKFLEVARQCADLMAHSFPDGPFYNPIMLLPSRSPLLYDESRWSRNPGCYQLKAALAWLELWHITNDDRYFSLYRNLLKPSLDTSQDFLPGSDTDTLVMDRLHAYCYFLEALFPFADHPECNSALSAGITRVSEYVEKISPQFLRCDVVAQLLRVRLFANQLRVVALDLQAAKREVAVIESFQCWDSDPRMLGGFWFGKKCGEYLPFVNPISAAFSMQTLQMWEQYRSGAAQFEWQSLI
jgi:hypothetical protein